MKEFFWNTVTANYDRIIKTTRPYIQTCTGRVIGEQEVKDLLSEVLIRLGKRVNEGTFEFTDEMELVNYIVKSCFFRERTTYLKVKAFDKNTKNYFKGFTEAEEYVEEKEEPILDDTILNFLIENYPDESADVFLQKVINDVPFDKLEINPYLNRYLILKDIKDIKKKLGEYLTSLGYNVHVRKQSKKNYGKNPDEEARRITTLPNQKVIEEIRMKFEEGYFMRELAILYNHTIQVIEAICKGTSSIKNEEGNKEHRKTTRIKLLASDFEEIKKKREEGVPVSELATEYKVPDRYIANICKAVNKSIKHKDAEAIREEYKNGSSLIELAEKYNVSKSTIQKKCKGIVRIKPKKIKQVKVKKNNTDLIDEIRNLYSTGLNISELAEKYNISRLTVRRYCTGLPKPDLYSDKQIEEIREAYRNGELIRNLEAKSNFSRYKIYQICKGIERTEKPHYKINPEVLKELREDYKSGLTQKELTSKYNLTYGVIYHYCKDLTNERKENQKHLEISEELIQELRELYRTGTTQLELGRRFKIGINKIREICKDVVKEPKVKEPKVKEPLFTDKQVEEIRELYKSGISKTELASKYNTKVYFITKVCKGITAKERRRGKRKIRLGEELVKRNQEIKDKLSSGYTKEELAKEYNLSLNRIRNITATGIFRTPNPDIIERNKTIYSKYKSGTPIKELVIEYKIDLSRLYQIIRNIEKGKEEDIRNYFENRNQEIINKKLEGYTKKEIAKQYNLSEKTVKMILKDLPKELIAKRNQEIVNRSLNGISVNDIALEFKLDRNSIWRILKQNNLKKEDNE